jgi:GNAT superfamily N-acetyltransferase
MPLREATAADMEAILELRARCFGEVDAEKRDPRFWHWEFDRARCFVGEEDDGRIVTHIALVPVTYAVNGTNVEGAMAVDAMTSPDARGRGWFSRVIAHATESAPALSTAYQIRKPVLGAMLRSGWVAVERVPVLVRPSGVKALARLVAPSVSEGPGRVGGAKESVDRAAPPPRPLAHARGDTIRVLTHDEVEWMARIASSDGLSIARTPEFLQWRFFDNPHWKYRITATDDAYLVARRTALKGFDTYAIVDVAGRAHALINDAIDEAKRLGCTLVAALASRGHAAFMQLLRHGFVPGPHRFRLLVHPRSPDGRWRVMWADTDHL